VRRLAPALVLSVIVALLATTPALAGSGDTRLTRVKDARFPERAFVLTLPVQRTLLPETVKVHENGRSVSRPSVIPADVVGVDAFASVLVLDATETMRGRPIKDAVAAAQAFVRKRNPQQRIGIVTFNRSARVVLPLTADGSEIADAFSAVPPLVDDGTHLYDAVATAVGLLEKAKIKAGSVVVLSDGADTGSRLSAEDVAARAEAAGVRVFTVGLRSRWFDRPALEGLANSGRGEYSEARSSAGLEPIYAALGSRLANEYMIRYRSRSRLGEQVHVSVTAPGLAATSEYIAPAPPVRSAEQEAAGKGFWGSAAALVAVCFLCALLFGFAVAVLLALRPRGRSLRQRIEGFAPIAVEEEGEQDAKPKMLVGAEKSLERTQWWATFKEALDIAQIEMPAIRMLVLTAVGTFVALWVLLVVSGSALVALIALGTPAVVWNVVARKADRQRKLFADQLAENLQVIASAMRAGHSFIGALSVAVEDAPEPAQSEFRRAVADEKLGVPLDETLSLIARRMRSRDLEQIVLVALLQRETGGNTAEVIDRVSETIRHRSELRRTVKTLTTQGRMARWIISLLPPFLMAAISVINPGYLEPLFSEPVGNLLLVVGSVMVITGSLVIKRIVDIEV
jgi:tight adherence protein B